MTKEDIKHINWMYNRLTSVYKENPNFDYMIRFKEIIDKQLTLCDVGSSLPNKEELLSISENIIEEKHKGLEYLEREWIKLGFLYYHRYLYNKSNSR